MKMQLPAFLYHQKQLPFVQPIDPAIGDLMNEVPVVLEWIITFISFFVNLQECEGE
jgi:hypothetical protein